MHITLRPGEKLYLNGAVLRADRKVSIELLNDANFLLETHIMSVEKATTPLRQLYFIVQTMLMNPIDTVSAQSLFDANIPRMMASYDDGSVTDALRQTNKLVGAQRYFEALKILRSLFVRDDALMAGAKDDLQLAS